MRRHFDWDEDWKRYHMHLFKEFESEFDRFDTYEKFKGMYFLMYIYEFKPLPSFFKEPKSFERRWDSWFIYVDGYLAKIKDQKEKESFVWDLHSFFDMLVQKSLEKEMFPTEEELKYYFHMDRDKAEWAMKRNVLLVTERVGIVEFETLGYWLDWSL